MKTLILSLLFLSTSAAAVYEGKIDRLEMAPGYGDIIYVSVVGSQPNRPACATNAVYDYAFDSGTKLGEKIFAALLAAQRAGSNVKISGLDSCTVGGSVEDLRWIQSL